MRLADHRRNRGARNGRGVADGRARTEACGRVASPRLADGNPDPADPFRIPNVESSLGMAMDYLQSPQAVQDVLKDPALSSLPSAPSQAVVAKCLREKIGIYRRGSVCLMKCWLTVDEPAPHDTAILDATASSLRKRMRAGPGAFRGVIEHFSTTFRCNSPSRHRLSRFRLESSASRRRVATARTIGGYLFSRSTEDRAGGRHHPNQSWWAMPTLR